jgi:HJR/Mrr/RecB family endonuclease
MSFCSNCGSQAKPGASFCGNCGTRLSRAPAAPPQYQQPPRSVFEGLREKNTSTAIQALKFANEQIGDYFFGEAEKVGGGAYGSIGAAIMKERQRWEEDIDEIAEFLENAKNRIETVEGAKYKHITSVIRSAADIYLSKLRSNEERTHSDVIAKLMIQAQDLLKVPSVASATPGLFDKYYFQESDETAPDNGSTASVTQLSPTQLQNLGDKEFEIFVKNVLRKMGFDAHVVGGAGDHNVDIVANRTDEFGYLEKWVVQCKRYAEENKVTGPMVLNLATAATVEHDRASACLVTSSNFTEEARVRAKSHHVRLINGRQLVALARKYG